ncbi:hypothetical protein Pmani_016757 [Petrolisthes manimaculis]|uniref:NAD(P)-binding domain-containing protein n=1 Tax=Petrolisthes manimaculis TaxID=1843537 RepID=A0AAE1U629_9EUCA|nr:hypothetical protein Pmani_016757 [Petrolisthes manimaculis]
MRLLVLGGTGQTGKEVVDQALKAGHSVTAFVRNPDKITTTHQNLEVVKGDVFNDKSLKPVLEGQDAVVSCLGFPRKPQPVTGYTSSASAIITAMRESNVRRIVTMTSWFTDTNSGKDMGFMVNWMIIPFLRPVLTNMRQMETFLETSASDINYTVVRPPQLKNGPLTDRSMSVSEDFVVNAASSSIGTNRSDVAAFMLSCLNTTSYDSKMVAITTTPKKNA